MDNDIAGLYNQDKLSVDANVAKPGTLPARQVMDCRRRLALRVLGEVEPTKEGAPWLSEGQMHEEEIIARLVRMGIRITEYGPKGGWFRRVLAGIRIRGQIDGIVPDLESILEIKTVGREAKLFEMTRPKREWRIQTEVYMRAFQLVNVILLAKARDTGRMRQWTWQRDERLWQAICHHVEMVAGITDPWELEVEYGRECAWCPWNSKCWGAPADIIEMAL